MAKSPETREAKGRSDPRRTPAMRQYYAFKEQFPDCVLLFRMGDFYESFDEDAVALHRTLGLTLTERTEGVPMAGVPHHSVEGYLKRLIEAGVRVAVCEQLQDPKDAKGVVERGVTRVLTPGALVDEALLRDDRANVLAAVAFVDAGDDSRAAAAVVEVSTGAFTIFDCPARDVADELTRRGAREVLYAESADGRAPARVQAVLDASGAAGTGRPAWQFSRDEAMDALRGQYGVKSLAGFGLRDDDPALTAAGAVVRYLRETQTPAAVGEAPAGASAEALARLRAASLAHLSPPKREDPAGFLTLDATTLRALEIERTVRTGEAGADNSLLGVLLRGTGRGGGCRTSMGKRLLREWLCRPLAERSAIESRQACVERLVLARSAREALGEALGGVQDVARIGARVALRRATPRDLVALGRSLERLDALLRTTDLPSDDEARTNPFAPVRAVLESSREALEPLAARIVSSCVETPPNHLREGGLFVDGVDAELDECRGLQRDASAWLAEYQRRLSEAHDLPGMKVGYNRVFGYFIELPRAQARRAPAEFARKQTLTQAERFTTPELTEFEARATTAQERAIAREQAMFESLCAEAGALLGPIARFGEAAAALDVLRCFAEHADRRGWTRPEMRDEPALEVVQGRHPVLDALLGERFVPNDLALGGGAPALALITGPNMAGKSTFIRQVALLAALAHAGSFVPADRAVIGVADRIFTRVGADDALHAGQSTFMVEMTETANILHHATARSIVALDEIGRGTSTLDGLSLAWAIAERLAGEDSAPAPRTLFATHYHELTQLEELLPGRVTNLHVAVREWPPGDPHAQIVFLHRILAGRTDKSYGVQVGRLAGLPAPVVARARALLESLSVSHEQTDMGRARERASVGSSPGAQMALFTEFLPHPAVEALKALEIERMSPLEAFDALRRLRDEARGDG